jgi:hypothetical protein
VEVNIPLAATGTRPRREPERRRLTVVFTARRDRGEAREQRLPCARATRPIRAC